MWVDIAAVCCLEGAVVGAGFDRVDEAAAESPLAAEGDRSVICNIEVVQGVGSHCVLAGESMTSEEERV